MATYGLGTAPSQNTINYDAILSTSLFNYQRTLTDNISKSNAFFYRIQENGMYEGLDGGIAIQIPLMYALAVPISISRKEERQNSSTDRIIDLLKSKIMQAELGIKEGFSKAILQGSYASGGTSVFTNATSSLNGASGPEPLFKLIYGTNGAGGTGTVGNINSTTSTWWQNQYLQSATSSSSKASDFLLEADKIFNTCAKGPGGPPDMVLTDQYTFQVWNTAYYQVYRRMADTDDNFPFPNIKFHNAVVTWDEFMPDVYNNTLTPNTGVGTAAFINTKFCSVKYDEETNFVATQFMKPVNQDARVAHILWMGNVCVSNRRKLGVWFNLPRTLTWAI